MNLKSKTLSLLALSFLLFMLPACQKDHTVHTNISSLSSHSVKKQYHEFKLTSVDFIDNRTGWMIGSNPNMNKVPVLLKTVDGGKNWSSHSFPKDTRAKSIQFINQKSGWAVAGTDCSSAATFSCKKTSILHTEDGGNTWKFQWKGQSHHGRLGHLVWLNTNMGFAIIDRKLMNTADGGLHWKTISFDHSSFYVDHVDFYNKTVGWVIGRTCSLGVKTSDSISNCQLEVLKTTDGGRHWIHQFHKSYALDEPYGPVGIRFVDSLNGWFLTTDLNTMKGTLYRTIDGGARWYKVNKISGARPFPVGLQWIQKDVGWIPLNGGTDAVPAGLLVTKDGGKHFNVIGRSQNWSLVDAELLTPNQGYAIRTTPNSGDNLIYTTDGGQKWVQLYPVLKQNKVLRPKSIPLH